MPRAARIFLSHPGHEISLGFRVWVIYGDIGGYIGIMEKKISCRV